MDFKWKAIFLAAIFSLTLSTTEIHARKSEPQPSKIKTEKKSERKVKNNSTAEANSDAATAESGRGVAAGDAATAGAGGVAADEAGTDGAGGVAADEAGTAGAGGVAAGNAATAESGRVAAGEAGTAGAGGVAAGDAATAEASGLAAGEATTAEASGVAAGEATTAESGRVAAGNAATAAAGGVAAGDAGTAETGGVAAGGAGMAESGRVAADGAGTAESGRGVAADEASTAESGRVAAGDAATAGAGGVAAGEAATAEANGVAAGEAGTAEAGGVAADDAATAESRRGVAAGEAGTAEAGRVAAGEAGTAGAGGVAAGDASTAEADGVAAGDAGTAEANGVAETEIDLAMQEKTVEDDQKKNYYLLLEEDEEPKFFQRLSWKEISGMKNYIVQIQRVKKIPVAKNDFDFAENADATFEKTFSDEATFALDGASDETAEEFIFEYEDIFKTELQETFVEVSLAAGDYRFRVGAKNLFDKIVFSKWVSFVVLKALQPIFSSVTPNPFYKNASSSENFFLIEGKNFFEETSLELRSLDNDEIFFQGKIVDSDESTGCAKALFDTSEFLKGKYEMFAVNPGGLSDSYGKIKIKNQIMTDASCMLCANYFLPFEIYDGSLSTFTEKKFIFPLNAQIQVAFIATIKDKTKLGFGVSAFYTRLNENEKYYALQSHLVSGLLNFIVQIPCVPKKLYADIHAGAGVSCMLGTSFDYSYTDYSSPKFNAMALAYGGGFALQYFPGKAKRFFVQAGADFIHSQFKDMNAGILRPIVGFGGMF